MAAGLLAGVLVVGAIGFGVRGDVKPMNWASFTSVWSQTPGGSKETLDVPGIARLGTILDIPPTSPSGRISANVSLEQALKIADTELAEDAAATNRDEAKYWLRFAIARGLDDRRLPWALTQLGTLYANPNGGAPDYTAARELWRIAAEKGDSVALCFLASLAEHGLSVEKNPQQALHLYRSAKALGGCPGINAAIARLQ